MMIHSFNDFIIRYSLGTNVIPQGLRTYFVEYCI